jgi:hypothetical protein
VGVVVEQSRRFRETLLKYLRSAEMIPLHEGMRSTGEYEHLCFMKTFYKDGDSKPHQLVTPSSEWYTFLQDIEDIFGSRINRKLLQRSIGTAVCELNEFPFTEKMLDEYTVQIFTELKLHYELTVEAIVPLHSMTIEGNTEIPLANAILCSGHQD